MCETFLCSNPQRSLDSGQASGRHQAAPRPTASLPASLVGGAGPTPSNLPSYDQCVPEDSPSWVGVGVAGGGVEADGGEEVIDENDRIAMQEAEDERLAREMLQKEDDEVGVGGGGGWGGEAENERLSREMLRKGGGGGRGVEERGREGTRGRQKTRDSRRR